VKNSLNYENFLVARPLWASFEDCKYGIPMMWETRLSKERASFARLLSFRHVASSPELKDAIIEYFVFDCDLESVWRNPFTNLGKLRKAAAVLSPDFSITPSMKEAQVIENTFKNRWMSCFWQQNSLDSIATASWAEPWTYEICLQGMRAGNPFAVSTIGVKDKMMFLNGYAYFYQKLRPSYVLCYGKVINGMRGSIIPFTYEEAWRPNKHYEQLKLFTLPRCLEMGLEDKENGR
jgi:hypothetical protein